MTISNLARCPICSREKFLCSDLTAPLKTHAEAKAAFHAFGIAIKHWAADHQVHFNSAIAVINGRSRVRQQLKQEEWASYMANVAAKKAQGGRRHAR